MSIYDIEALAYSGLHRDKTYRLRRTTAPTAPIASFEDSLRAASPRRSDRPAGPGRQVPLSTACSRRRPAEIERYCDRALMAQD